jgi:hypothetical protein
MPVTSLPRGNPAALDALFDILLAPPHDEPQRADAAGDRAVLPPPAADQHPDQPQREEAGTSAG